MTTYPTGTPHPTGFTRRQLRRCTRDRMLAGVAAGAAEHLDVDVTTVRIALVVLALFGGIAVPLYVAAWLLVPEEDSQTSILDDLLHRSRI